MMLMHEFKAIFLIIISLIIRQIHHLNYREILINFLRSLRRFSWDLHIRRQMVSNLSKIIIQNIIFTIA